jgi:AcrR family transcriptional regulator
VLRTKDALTQALIELVLARRYRTITIQHLLDRANVGRSTFYAHYRGKDDLLLRSFERLIEMLDESVDGDGADAARIAPVRELFHHLAGFRRFHDALVQGRMAARVYHAGTMHMAETIGRRLATRPTRLGDTDVPTPIAARAYAGALFALLRWWLDNDMPHTPERMDEMFQAIVIPGGPGVLPRQS